MSIEDAAQDHELMVREATQRRAAAGQGPVEYGPAGCEDCESEMPAARREYGFRLCVPCQTSVERRAMAAGGSRPRGA